MKHKVFNLILVYFIINNAFYKNKHITFQFIIQLLRLIRFKLKMAIKKMIQNFNISIINNHNSYSWEYKLYILLRSCSVPYKCHGFPHKNSKYKFYFQNKNVDSQRCFGNGVHVSCANGTWQRLDNPKELLPECRQVDSYFPIPSTQLNPRGHS